MRNLWTTFETKWEEKIVKPDSKEGTITLAEHRTRTSVQTAMKKFWAERKEKEDKITKKKYEMHAKVERLSEKSVNLKNRHDGSAASEEHPWNWDHDG